MMPEQKTNNASKTASNNDCHYHPHIWQHISEAAPNPQIGESPHGIVHMHVQTKLCLPCTACACAEKNVSRETMIAIRDLVFFTSCVSRTVHRCNKCQQTDRASKFRKQIQYLKRCAYYDSMHPEIRCVVCEICGCPAGI